MRELARFLGDEAGGVADTIVTIGILVIVGGAILVSIYDEIIAAAQRIGNKIDELAQMP